MMYTILYILYHIIVYIQYCIYVYVCVCLYPISVPNNKTAYSHFLHTLPNLTQLLSPTKKHPSPHASSMVLVSDLAGQDTVSAVILVGGPSCSASPLLSSALHSPSEKLTHISLGKRIKWGDDKVVGHRLAMGTSLVRQMQFV